MIWHAYAMFATVVLAGYVTLGLALGAAVALVICEIVIAVTLGLLAVATGRGMLWLVDRMVGIGDEEDGR